MSSKVWRGSASEYQADEQAGVAGLPKNAKASFWSLKGYKVFYIKFHSVQQNELYAFIQVICLHPYPINIVSDSIYSVFVLKM